MAGQGTDLEAPVLLIAMPQVLDRFFFKSVVLLVHQSEEGAFGLILNRVTPLSVKEILGGMELEWHGDPAAAARFGGPVQPQVGTVLFSSGAAEPATGTAVEIADGVLLSQHVGDLGRLAQAPPAEFRLFLGYAGWGAGQLLEEILRNDWITAPVDPTLVFADDADTVWAQALRTVGVDPDTLPAWTSGDGEGRAN